VAAGDGGNGGISSTVTSRYFYGRNDVDHNGSEVGEGQQASAGQEAAEAAGWAVAKAIEPKDAVDLLRSVSEV